MGNVVVSSSGVRRLPEPSEDAEEPAVRTGRTRGGLSVSTGVFGALEERVMERILARRGAGIDVGGAVCVEWECDDADADAMEAEAEALSVDLPPRPLENADAMERITSDELSQSIRPSSVKEKNALGRGEASVVDVCRKAKKQEQRPPWTEGRRD